ncbi:MAG: GAF domain-containing protein [Chloroflexi bacterium]|nr:GAF domain-containing protein [Chloroflexota bacterium]
MMPRPIIRSLRTKIIAWSFVPTAIILMAVALIAFYAYQQVTEELAIERDRELTRLSANQLAARLGEYEDIFVALARIPEIYQDAPAIQRDVLKQASNRLTIFDGGVLLLDAFGTVLAAEPERPHVLGQRWSDRTYYHQVVRSQIAGSPPGLIVSDIVADGPGGTDVIVCALPLVGEQGHFRGMLAGLFQIGPKATNTFYGDIVGLRIDKSGSTYLVDGSGRVLYHSDIDRIGEDLSLHEIVQQVLRGQSNAIRTRDFAGQDIVAGFAPVPGTNWGLVTEEPWSTLIRGFRKYQNSLLFLLALGVVFPTIVVTVGVRQITKPITDLMSAAEQVAKGNFGQTIVARTGDEIEELASQFNTMSAQLAESYTTLERRVADRTRELAALNAIAGVVSRSLDLDEILNNALDSILTMLNAEAGIILLLEPGKQIMTLRAHRGFSEELAKSIAHVPLKEGISGQAVAQGKPIVLNMSDYVNTTVVQRTTYTEHMVPRLLEEGAQILISTPITHKGQVLGALTLATQQSRVFTPQELELLAAIGQQIGVGVENAWLYTSIQQELVERKRTEEQSQQYAAQLAEANVELSQYAYVVSHDLKTPLRAIHNYSDFLSQDLAETIDGDQKAYLDGLGRAVREAEELVDGLLALSRIGRRNVPVDPVNMGAFLQETIALLDLPTDVQIIMADDWPTIDVQPVLLGQIFQNLIGNAVKFTVSPHKRIELGWRSAPSSLEEKVTEEESTVYEFFVRDNGIGIDSRYHKQIFRVFERLHTSREYEGTGIGLAIVKKAVSQLDGSVRVESKLGEGSTFFVTLPKTPREISFQ